MPAPLRKLSMGALVLAGAMAAPSGARAQDSASEPQESHVRRSPRGVCEGAPDAGQEVLYHGGVVPPCARVVRRPYRAVTAAGVGIFLLGYLPVTIYGVLGAPGATPCWDCLLLAVPVVGPLLWPSSYSGYIAQAYPGLVGAFVATDVLLQVAGVVTMALGARGERVLVRDERARRAFRWDVVPIASEYARGVGVRVVGF